MTRRAVYTLVVAVAALVRLAYFTAHLASPLVDRPVLDGAYYDAAARAIAAGERAPGLFTGFRSLFYPRLLAAGYSLAGEWDLYAALALQHALGIGTAALVAALAFRLWRRPGAAFAAGLVYALGAPPLFFEGELLVETLFTASVAALLVALAATESASGRRALGWAFAAGALVAVGLRLRPNHLLFALALPLLLLPRATRAARRTAIGVALGAAVATTLLLALVERPLVGRVQLVPSAGAVNLYLGNKRTSDGMIPRQDWSVTYAEPYRDSVEVFAEGAFRRAHALAPDAPVPPAELSRYWLGRTFAELAADPWGRLALVGKKALRFLWNAEIPNNRSFAFAAKEEVRLLGWLPVRFGVLLALGAAGLAATTAELRRSLAFQALALFALVHAAGVVLFFVNDRYRLPVWPALAALAGGGLTALGERAAARRWRELGAPLAAAAAGALVAFPNWTGATLPGPGRDHLFRSTALLAQGRVAEARRDAERAAAMEPHEVSAWLQLGHSCLRAGDLAGAENAYRRALARHPNHTAALHGLGETAERAGAVGAAHDFYCAAVAAQPGFAPPVENAARLERSAGLAPCPQVARPR